MAVTITSISTSVKGSEVGLYFVQDMLVANLTFPLSFDRLSFPLTGAIRVTDNRTQCVTISGTTLGGCSRDVNFTLSVVVMNPGCPVLAYRFIEEPNTAVTWTEPMAILYGPPTVGNTVVLVSNHKSGDVFSTGV
jgi:hypothetical protein